jgi:Tfp pilus assembly protein PilE
MKINKKLPAFTLMEVTISMLITAIAIAITYTAYRIINNTYVGYTRKQDRVAAFTELDKLLKMDFQTADHVVKTEHGIQVKSVKGQITYQFDSAAIIRNQFMLRLDTFKLPVKSIHYSFEQQEVPADQPVDQLELRLQLEDQDVQLLYPKHYSSQNLFN